MFIAKIKIEYFLILYENSIIKMGGGNSDIIQRQSRTIDRLLDLIDRQSEMIKHQQQIIQEKTNQLDVLFSKQIPVTTLTEAYERARPTDAPNGDDSLNLAETKETNTPISDTPAIPIESLSDVSDTMIIPPLKELLDYVKYVDMMYDSKCSKLYYLISLKDEIYMEKFVNRFHLQRPANNKLYWSYDQLFEYTNKNFPVSYEWIGENFPDLIQIIKTNGYDLKIICKYITTNLMVKIEFKDQHAEIDPIKCSTSHDMFISDLFMEHFHAKYDFGINKIIMPLEDAKKVIELAHK